jgi:hypothetical protein
MIHSRRVLPDGLGVASDEPLSAESASAMRRIVVAEARAHAHDEASWSSRSAVVFALTVLLMIAAGVTVGRRIGSSAPGPADADAKMSVVVPVPSPPPPRQLQFATPGGTRIIWVFNSDLELKVTNP